MSEFTKIQWADTTVSKKEILGGGGAVVSRIGGIALIYDWEQPHPREDGVALV